MSAGREEAAPLGYAGLEPDPTWLKEENWAMAYQDFVEKYLYCKPVGQREEHQKTSK